MSHDLTSGRVTGVAAQPFEQVRAEVAKAVVGQQETVTGLLIALLVGGHVLLEGVPGTAKTLLAKSLAAALALRTQRVQFTPDLMPSDVTGQVLYRQQTGEFVFREGPVFTNLLLADEVNRTPPKTQAALLEAMEERQVTVEGQPRALPEPFLVVATQNPVEYEGTYPLPEAQLDRFLLKLVVGYPDAEQERAVLTRHDQGFDPHDLTHLAPVAGPHDLRAGRQQLARIRVEPDVLGYAVELVRATRHTGSFVLGVSPRGGTMLFHASKAWALLSGRDFVTPDDVRAVALPTLRHRVQLRPELELEGAGIDAVLSGVLAGVSVPR